ncbi:hypothetical protein [Streptomyces sp. NPDC046805]
MPARAAGGPRGVRIGDAELERLGGWPPAAAADLLECAMFNTDWNSSG